MTPMLALVYLASAFGTGIVSAGRASSCEDLPFPPSRRDVESFTSRTYDYLIIGGGTAGIVIASRLAERTSFQIGVIEAGAFHNNDPNVDVPSRFTFQTAPSYDWGYTTSPQTNAGLRNVSIPRGKGLGGSSGRNQMAFSRASSIEYDSWSIFAQSDAWSWSRLLPYFRSTEKTAPLDPYQNLVEGATLGADPVIHGYSGSISSSFNALYSPEIPFYLRALDKLGVKVNPTPDNGNPLGVFNTPLSVDRIKGVRSYAASEYYCNQPKKSNLHILTGAQVSKIRFSGSAPKLIATGVDFYVGKTQPTYTVRASKEVILSAGTVNSPQVLELSGIGNSSLLQSLKIPVLFNSPGIGENFQEHCFFLTQYELAPGFNSFDALRKNTSYVAEQQVLYNETGAGLLAALDSTLAFLPIQTFSNPDRLKSLLDIFDKEAAAVDPSSLRAIQYRLQREWLTGGNVSAIELISWSNGAINPQPGKSYTSILGGIMHPLSRGSIHITSKNPSVYPKVDPAFLSSEFDAQVLLDAIKFVQKIGKQDPLSSIIAGQTAPDPQHQDDQSLLTYIRNGAAGGAHLVGTAAMAPFENGGVVDASLRVYGTQNLRVVDASIIPTQIGAHTQATVYAFAEAAVDIIIDSSK